MWIVNSFLIVTQPIYMDSFFTIGAGAKLFFEGHSAPTFMLYGLINPFILEGLLNCGFGPSAPFMLRFFQLLMGLGTILFLGLSLKRMLERVPLILCVATSAFTVLSSTALMKEFLEPVPETGMAFTVSMMIYLMLRYKPGFLNNVIAGGTIALLIGFRPTAFPLSIPVFFILYDKRYDTAGNHWRWLLLTVSLLIPLILAFPSLQLWSDQIRHIVLLFLLLTVLMAVKDIAKGNHAVWIRFLTILTTSAVVIFIAFPHYINHWEELLRQINDYHVSREYPIADLGDFTTCLACSLVYLIVVFPGPLAAIGFLAGAGFVARERESFPQSRILLSFALGLLPFLLIACRNNNFQSRYLIPLLPIFLLFASWGILRLLQNRYFSLLLILPFLLSTFQLAEGIHNDQRGGTLTALKDLSELPPAPVTVFNFNVCCPEYYADTDPVFYPILPFVSPVFHRASIEEAHYCIALGDLPEGFEVLNSYGQTVEEHRTEMRNSKNKAWTDLSIILRAPYTWRDWGITTLGVKTTL